MSRQEQEKIIRDEQLKDLMQGGFPTDLPFLYLPHIRTALLFSHTIKGRAPFYL